jgi:hypothetical protein
MRPPPTGHQPLTASIKIIIAARDRTAVVVA